jgi:hypothetical protein
MMEPENRMNWRIASCWALALLGVGFYLGLAVSAAAQDVAAGDSAVAPQVVYLDYRETPDSFLHISLSFSPQAAPFRKEPGLSQGQVYRGLLQFGTNSDQALPFIWDCRQARLYLDLNRNQDLTDDPAGVFSAPSRGFGNYYQTFTNIHLRFATPEGARQIQADLNCYAYNDRLSLSAACRSFWDGRISLQGRDWQLGIAEGAPGSKNFSVRDYLILRPWEARSRPFNLQDGTLDGFPFHENFCFGQQAYRLKPAWVRQENQLRLKLEFEPQPAATGELKLTGKFVDRLFLTPAKDQGTFAVLLDSPGPAVQVPTGTYRQSLVTLKQGNTEAHRDQGRDPGRAIIINASKPAVLTCGGPLTNTVSASRHGRQLQLEYALVGAGGQKYQLTHDNRSKPPQFAAYRGDKQIASHKFEFG